MTRIVPLGRIILAFCLLAALTASALSPARAAASDPTAFIQGLGDQAIKLITDKSLTREARREQFTKLFTASFDVPSIGRFVLGRYWRTATPQQQSEYLQLFGEYVVSVYSDRFTDYSGEKFKVTGTRKDDDTNNTVSSEIDRPNGGPPIKIDWRVTNGADGYKITDVIVENLSMAITQRSEFSSIIERGGGNVDALIALLKQKLGKS
ncbi:MAG TPA: ABC transporter substrate-binding protein [Stellaceae bacterium]|nr:ABC transporter substrate-binding protein [Stellaceae bacterium]